jgi:hypothetical protein
MLPQGDILVAGTGKHNETPFLSPMTYLEPFSQTTGTLRPLNRITVSPALARDDAQPR